MCFAFQVVSLGSPDILRGLLDNVALALQKLTAASDPLIDALACPELSKYDKAFFEKVPWSR